MLRIIYATLFAAFISLAQGQQKKSDATIKFVAEIAPPELGQVALVAGEVKGSSFALPMNNLSEPIGAPARVCTLNLVAKNLPLAKITLPESGNKFICLLLPIATGGYSPVIIPANETSFSPGDYYFYNRSNKTILGYVGKATFILPPGKGQPLKPTGAIENRLYDIGLGYRDKEGDKVVDKPLSQSRWPLQAQMRTYIFFYNNPKTQQIEFRAVDEFINPEQK